MTEEHNTETNEQTSRQPDPANETEPRPAQPQRRPSMLPVLLSVLAVALAAVSLAGVLKINQRLNARQPDRGIEHRLAAVESRVSHVESLLTTSRHDMVRAELKKMLLNLQELSRLADDETRNEIAKAEAVLLKLSSPRTRVRAKVDVQGKTQNTRQPRASDKAKPKPGTAQPARPAKATASHPSSKPSIAPPGGKQETPPASSSRSAAKAGPEEKGPTTAGHEARPAHQPAKPAP